jgi:Pyruvate/2-oxoacid:ferredoxin oxidoreductase delta subunit
MSRKTEVIFEPNPEQMALMPDHSGNDVNGLGEAEFRRPSRVYWHHPAKIAHGKVQQWMVQRFNAVPVFKDAYATGDRGPRELDPIAQIKQQDSPENWSARVKAFALQNEADLAGITPLDPGWLYSDRDVPDSSWIIVLGVAMDHARLAQAPSSDEDTVSALEVAVQYNRSARVAAHLANWIRGQGYEAQAHAGPWAGPVTLTPAALACGLGELGKHGNIINRQYGSSFRISGVITDMPLVADEADEFGADEFCTRCQVCINACPPDAIANEKQMVRGVNKWYVDFDKCVPYFNETHGCGICIAVCPWSRPGAAPRLAEKMLRRRQRN